MNEDCKCGDREMTMEEMHYVIREKNMQIRYLIEFTELQQELIKVLKERKTEYVPYYPNYPYVYPTYPNYPTYTTSGYVAENKTASNEVKNEQ